MFDIDRWQEIFEAIGKNKLRTFLTGLSVASGIFILVILLGFSSGIQKGVKSQFEQDAVNRVSIRTRVTTKEYKGLNPGRRIQLHNDDFSQINTTYDDQLEYKTAIYNMWSSHPCERQQKVSWHLWLKDRRVLERTERSRCLMQTI